jgi:hypothetical protein
VTLDRLLAGAVRLLPPDGRDWGAAMRAELIGVGPHRERRRFVLGCIWAIVTRPPMLRRLGYPLLTLAVLAGTVRATSGVAAPGRWVLCAIVDGYLLGFLALTTRRAAVTRRTLAIGAGTAAAAVGLFVVLAFVFAPIPPDAMPATGLVAVAMLCAAYAFGRGRARQMLLAALFAGSVTAVSVFGAVLVLSTFGPARLIPDLARAALTPADDLAQSRHEIQDPYVWMLLVGWVITVVQGLVALAARPRSADREPGADRVLIG